MKQGARPAVEAGPSGVRKSRRIAGSTRRQLEQRLADALEQHAAISEILQVISASPSDVRPVFDTIVAAARKLCGASSANVVTFDGKLIHVAALVPLSPEGTDALHRHFGTYPRPPSSGYREHPSDPDPHCGGDPRCSGGSQYAAGATAVAAGYRSVLSVPLMRDESPIGAITVARPNPGHSPKRRSLSSRHSPIGRRSQLRTCACSTNLTRVLCSSRGRSASSGRLARSDTR